MVVARAELVHGEQLLHAVRQKDRAEGQRVENVWFLKNARR